MNEQTVQPNKVRDDGHAESSFKDNTTTAGNGSKFSLMKTITKTLPANIKHIVRKLVVLAKRICARVFDWLPKTSMTKKFRTSNKKPIVWLFLGIFFITFILALAATHKSHQLKQVGPTAVSNLMRINNIQDSLGKLQNNLTTTSQMSKGEQQRVENKLQEIDARLGQIARTAGASKGNQIKTLRATLQSANLNLTEKINALNAEVKVVKAKVFPAPTLDAKALPFNVIAIEPWNGKPYVEIRQKQNATMIDYVGLYGVRGGWKVIDLDAPDQTVTFLNQRGQIVHVAVTFKEQVRG